MTRLMRSCWCSFLALCGLAAFAPFALAQGAVNTAAPDSAAIAVAPHLRRVVAANTEFGFQMLGQLSRSTPDNVFISPFGITSALTMALGGAGGSTQRGMASTLGLGALTQDQINQANALLLPSLTHADPSVELSVASALWANTGTAFSPTFQDMAAKFYQAHVQTLDLAAPNAAGTINGWLKTNTHGKIDNLIRPRDLVGATGILTNAVYFHGTWQNRFAKSATHNGLFKRDDGTAKTLPLMSQVETYFYLDTSDFQAVSLPYGTGRLSLYVFLPKTGKNLDTFVNGLTGEAWEGWMGKMKSARVTLTLPRFTVDYEAPLNQPLIALGMGLAFAPGADFSPMGLSGPSDQSSSLTGVAHQAILEVDEDGTVAAAATAVVAGGLGGGFDHPPVVMRVDHPFFCAIRDNVTGAVLFAGVIRDPS